MGGVGFRELGVALVLTLVVLGLWLLVPKLLGGAAGTPDTQVITRLHDALVDGVRLDVPGSEAALVGSRVKLGPTTVHLDERGPRAIAVAMLDFTGRFGDTQVTSLGYERIPFVQDARGRWVPEDGLAPRLSASVGALEARRRALEAGDVETLTALAVETAPAVEEVSEVRELRALQQRTYVSKAWVLRSEREAVQVAEHFRLQGDAKDRPVDRVGLRNLTLVPQGETLLFSPGVM